MYAKFLLLAISCCRMTDVNASSAMNNFTDVRSLNISAAAGNNKSSLLRSSPQGDENKRLQNESSAHIVVSGRRGSVSDTIFLANMGFFKEYLTDEEEEKSASESSSGNSSTRGGTARKHHNRLRHTLSLPYIVCIIIAAVGCICVCVVFCVCIYCCRCCCCDVERGAYWRDNKRSAQEEVIACNSRTRSISKPPDAVQTRQKADGNDSRFCSNAADACFAPIPTEQYKKINSKLHNDISIHDASDGAVLKEHSIDNAQQPIGAVDKNSRNPLDGSFTHSSKPRKNSSARARFGDSTDEQPKLSDRLHGSLLMSLGPEDARLNALI